MSSTPVSRATSTGLNQPAGDILVVCSATGSVSTGDAIADVNFGKPITNSTAYPSGRPIALTGLSGSFAAVPPSISSVNNGIVTIDIPAQMVPSDGSFGLTGVLLDLTGTSFGVPAAVSVSPGANVVIPADQNTVTVITAVLAGLATPRLTPAASTAALLVDGTVLSPKWSVDIPENYIDAFRSSDYFLFGTTAATNGVRVSIRFTGIPAGVTFGGCIVSAFVTGNSPSPGTPVIVGGASTLTSVANSIDVDWASQPSLFQTDTLRFGCSTITVDPGATLPLNVGAIGVQATLAPTGSAFASDGSILTDPSSGQIPRYGLSLLPATPLTIARIVPFNAPRRGQITSQD